MSLTLLEYFLNLVKLRQHVERKYSMTLYPLSHRYMVSGICVIMSRPFNKKYVIMFTLLSKALKAIVSYLVLVIK